MKGRRQSKKRSTLYAAYNALYAIRQDVTVITTLWLRAVSSTKQNSDPTHQITNIRHNLLINHPFRAFPRFLIAFQAGEPVRIWNAGRFADSRSYPREVNKNENRRPTSQLSSPLSGV